MRFYHYSSRSAPRSLLYACVLVGASALFLSATAIAEPSDNKPVSSIPAGVGLSMHSRVHVRQTPTAGDDGATQGLQSWGKFRKQQAAAKKARSDKMSNQDSMSGSDAQ